MATIRAAIWQVTPGVLGIAAVTAVCFPLHVNFAIPAFLFLLTVVLRSPAVGFASSAIVSLIAVLCLDYFFTPPILQLEVANPIDGVALAAYLATSLVITRLAAEARQKADAAEWRQQALARLYRIVWRLFSVEPQAVSGPGALQIFHDVLDVQAICQFDGRAQEFASSGNANERLAEMTRLAYESGTDYEDRDSLTWIQSLQVAGRRIGAIGFQGLSDGESMAVPLSMLAAASLERAESFEAASAAAATAQVETLRSAIIDAFAHQFKTPLAAILTAAGGIRETHGLSVQQAEFIEMIETESLRLNRMATRLLATARLNRDDVRPALEPTNLTDLIARLAGQRPPDAHPVSMNLGSAAVEVASDQELLSLAVTQLLDNAFKYAAAGSTVQIRLESTNQSAYVRVRNRGSFIPPAEQERIFERFYRGAAARRIATGAGLGLYVARKIAHAHAGSLDLEESTPDGRQTTFCLTLPILGAEPQHAHKAS